jgi:uncharacterized LabA/DUF88 family protein
VDRCVVLVDAGYLLGAAASLLCDAPAAGQRRPGRAALTVNYDSLIAAIGLEAIAQSGIPLLRILWYDGAPDARPTRDHRTLAILPDVKVRLGMLVQRDGKTEQKGVDSYLQRDMTALARNQAAADLILIGGDEDLRRGVEEAQDHGVKVHLWGVEAAAAQYNQALSLIAEADRRWVISAAWIAPHVSVPMGDANDTLVETESPKVSAVKIPVSPVPGERDGDTRVFKTIISPMPSPQTVAKPTEFAKLVAATPADLAKLAAQINTHGARPTPLPPAPTNGIPLLRELTNDRQEWEDNEEDATSGALTPDGAGARFARRWIRRATPDQVQQLHALAPALPRHLDGELLRFAYDQGIDTWAEDESAKFAVRAAARLCIRLTTSESDPSNSGAL